MALETGTYISDLVATNPDPTDSESYGALHLQLVKSTLKASFPQIAGPVPIAHDQFASKNYVNQTAFTTALPGQANTGPGYYVTTNGTAASWAPINANDICLIAQGII
ncbi:hypothetical protein PQR01_00405 [Paraburkholderia rhynchosiae]|uniref:Uncharacterized protein n=1 Tax=Paraburkholderia rhynchosiae TaxID=487049 RepID=A0ACC7N4M1_9BURK